MTESVTNAGSTQKRTSPWVNYAAPLALLLVLIAAFFAYRTLRGPQTATTARATAYLSPGELEERYGLGVRLIGVTGGGGLIDCRLKILDVEKARGFLQDPANLPRLIADCITLGEALVSP